MRRARRSKRAGSPAGIIGSRILARQWAQSSAHLPPVIEKGGAWYATLGVENANGTRVFSLSGNVARGGNYELPLGISLREVIYDIGGGVPGGRKLKAVVGSVRALRSEMALSPAERVPLLTTGDAEFIGKAAPILKALGKIGKQVSEIDLYEINEAFAQSVSPRWHTSASLTRSSTSMAVPLPSAIPSEPREGVSW